MRRRRIAIAVVLVAGLAAVLLTRGPAPRVIDGSGRLYGHLWCMGIAFDAGEGHPVHAWPEGLHAETIPGADPVVVLKDPSGVVRFREGDRVTVASTLFHADGGDTACAHLDSLSVTSLERLSTAAPSP